jgi:hypothetical protein
MLTVKYILHNTIHVEFFMNVVIGDIRLGVNDNYTINNIIIRKI